MTRHVTSGSDCWKLKPTDSVKVPELFTLQEEADTRMFLHCKHASEEFNNIVIHTPDTDVLVIGLTMQSQINAELFIKTGVKIVYVSFQCRVLVNGFFRDLIILMFQRIN